MENITNTVCLEEVFEKAMFEWGKVVSLSSLEGSLWGSVSEWMVELMVEHRNETDASLSYAIRYTTEILCGQVIQDEAKYLRVAPRYREEVFKRDVVRFFSEGVKQHHCISQGMDSFEQQRGQLASFTDPVSSLQHPPKDD